MQTGIISLKITTRAPKLETEHNAPIGAVDSWVEVRPHGVRLPVGAADISDMLDTPAET